MASVMIQCNGEKNGIRCQRRCRVVTPKGAVASDDPYTCEGCKTGKDPYSPRSSARKGQQKQAKKK